MVRLSGPQAIVVGRRVFKSKPPLGRRIRHVEYGEITDASGVRVDRGLAWVLKAPASYTGEDTVEITTHGSDVILDCVVQAAAAHGAVLAGPGEFTRRAFLNGRIDLIEAEAVVELIQSAGRVDLGSAYGQASGRLSDLVNELKADTVAVLSTIEAGLDFSDEGDVSGRLRSSTSAAQLSEIVKRSSALIDTFEGSRRRHRGFAVALIGRPNVGKSTLLNALLGEERAIVSPIPGTTRDRVEGQTVWSGEAIRLVDTAGLRATAAGPVEEEGMRRTREIAAEADVAIAVLDGSAPRCRDDEAIIDLLTHGRGLVVATKRDLGLRLDLTHLRERGIDAVFASGLRQEGLDEIREAVCRLLPRPNLVDGIGLTRQRHHDLLSKLRDSADRSRQMMQAGTATEECVAAELHEGLRALGELLGESVDEAVLDRIFAEFCIGK